MKNQVPDIQDALVQVERCIRLEEDENLIGRKSAITLRESNEEAGEDERLHGPIRQKDR